MKQENFDKLKTLNSFSQAIDTFWDRYDAAIADLRCDKHEATFNGDDRFITFRTNGFFFSSFISYYGNSGRSAFAQFNNDLANHYFVIAINELKREIFSKMAAASKIDEAKLAVDAKTEINDVQNAVALAEQSL